MVTTGAGSSPLLVTTGSSTGAVSPFGKTVTIVLLRVSPRIAKASIGLPVLRSVVSGMSISTLLSFMLNTVCSPEVTR